MLVKKIIDRAKLVDAAMQRIECDTTIENIHLINVVTSEIYPASVDILDGMIVRVRNEGEKTTLPSKEIIDGEGKYLLPGFIDPHMHVESSHMVPENFGKTAVTWGTTTVVTDPHEIGNVDGIEGIKYMIESAKRAPLRQYILAPSCVPAIPSLESSGASFGPDEISELLELDRVIGVAELMDYVGVYNNDPRMRGIIDEAIKTNTYRQGHAPYVTGERLAAYITAGVESDHEIQNKEEMLEKIRMGMNVNIKAVSFHDQTKDFVSVLKTLKHIDNVSLCTDDVHVGEVTHTGHINYNIRRVIEEGLDTLDAIRLTTINPAKEFNFKDLGKIAPGYIADLQLVEDLEFVKKPSMVFVDGKLVSKDGMLTGDKQGVAWTNDKNTINIPNINNKNMFVLKVPVTSAKTVEVATIQSELFNRVAFYTELPIIGETVDISNNDDLCFISSINRYGTGELTIALLKDFGLQEGAIATSVSHDNHNITLIYNDPKDAYVALQKLKEVGGGVVTVRNQKVLSCLELPVGGLMSPLPNKELASMANETQASIQELCNNPRYKLLSVFLFSLPAIKGYCITNKGVVSGDTKHFFPIFNI